jgi:hypothetical protein
MNTGASRHEIRFRGHKEVWRALLSFIRNATNGEQIWTYVQPPAPDYARRHQAINEVIGVSPASM